MATVLDSLRCLINQVDDAGGACCPAPIAAPCPQFSPLDFPFLQVCMMEPPCCMAPTAPQYVKPLTLPDVCPRRPPPRDLEMEFNTRVANFYNYHNCDYHKTGCELCLPPNPRQKRKPKYGENYALKKYCPPAGCPTGFKPCIMRMTPSCSGGPLSAWTGTVMPCAEKPKQKYKYRPGPCKKPCCLHWIPDPPYCRYDLPCKAHCYNHPPGAKPGKNCCC